MLNSQMWPMTTSCPTLGERSLLVSSTDFCTAKFSVPGTSLELGWLRLSQVLTSQSFMRPSASEPRLKRLSFTKGLSLLVLLIHPVISVLVSFTLL